MTLKIDYDDFVEKFKPKKTTDDCYTPENIYNAVLDWCVKEYGVDKNKVVRPFYPGGDYENFDLYAPDSVVIDNPPFSILAQIVGFYAHYEIKFFLFAPTLTLFSSPTIRDRVCFLTTGADIIYENGAAVKTSFITNLEDKELQCRTTPDLREILDKLNQENKAVKKLPKYKYPPELITSTQLDRLSRNGIDFRFNRSQCYSISKLDAQKALKKGIFGDGFLLSRAKTAERLAAEQQIQDEKLYFQLSDREQQIINMLD